MSAFKPGERAVLLVDDGKVRAEGLVASTDGERHEVTVRVELFTPNAERTLRREGWRARIAHVESLLADREVAEGLDDWTDGNWHTPRSKVEQALAEVRALLDGDSKPTEGLVHLDADDLERIESWLRASERAWGGFVADGGRPLLDRLRREVGA